MNFLGMMPLNASTAPAPTARVATPIADQAFEDKAHLFSELSICAYFNLEDAKKWAQVIGFTQIVQVSFRDDLTVTIFSTPSDIVLAFRGVQNLSNLEYVLKCDREADGVLTGKAHKGFLVSFNRVWPLIAPILDSTKKVWATGHSLGGAMAAIAAVRAARREGPNLDGVFTFGQPRIGNGAYVSALGTDSYRWVNCHDPVPSLPTKWMGYAHFGKEFFIKHDGNVIERNPIFRLLTFLGSIINYAPHALDDHDVLQYRSAILRANIESANGQR